MDNTTNPALDQSLASNTRRRRISRTGMLWIALGCCLFGIVTFLIWLQSATYSLARAQVAEARAQARGAERLRWLPQDTYNPAEVLNDGIRPPQPNKNTLAGNAFPPISGTLPVPSPNSPIQANVRYVEENIVVTEFNQRTGKDEMVVKTRQVPITVIGQSYSNNAEDTQAEARVQHLANQYRNAEPAMKERYSQSLTQVLTELFDARHKAQSSRVEALKIEVQQTQELLDKRLQNKSKIIERRVKELTGQQDELSWNASVHVATPKLPGIENSPFPTPVQNSGFTPANNTVPYSPVNNYSPTFTNPQLFTAPSGILPSAQPVEIPRTSPELDNSPSKTFRTSDLNADESLPTPNANPTPTFVPVSPSPASNNPVNGSLESQRSFMNIGFKLKGLMRQLEGEQSIKGATKVKSEIEETKAVWEFEKSSLESELESAESEYQLVTKQLDHAKEQVDIQRNRVNGTSADGKLDYSKAEVAKSEVERQLLQLRSRMTTLKKSIDWMENFFKDKPTSPPSNGGEPEARPLFGTNE